MVCQQVQRHLCSLRITGECIPSHGSAFVKTESASHSGKVRMARGTSTALLLIDVINHFEFPDGKRTFTQSLRIAPGLRRLKERARRAGVPVIYVNDNFGRWRSQMSELVAYCTRPEAIGRRFVEQLRPDRDDYFVLKPRHSAFYQTPLEVLLEHLGASTLILCGLATNSCVLCTAQDAKMRNLRLIVPSDGSASRTRAEHEQAIQHIKTMIDAITTPTVRLRLPRRAGAR
jgi:nicotinamidase-related amidase